jgi:hypothetical protein
MHRVYKTREWVFLSGNVPERNAESHLIGGERNIACHARILRISQYGEVTFISWIYLNLKALPAFLVHNLNLVISR